MLLLHYVGWETLGFLVHTPYLIEPSGVSYREFVWNDSRSFNMIVWVVFISLHIFRLKITHSIIS